MTAGIEPVQSLPDDRAAALLAPRVIAWSAAAATSVTLSTLAVGVALAAGLARLGFDTAWFSDQSALVQVAYRLVTMGLPYAATLGLVAVFVHASRQGWGEGLGLRGFVVLPGLLLAAMLAIMARAAATAWTVTLLRFGLSPPEALDVMARFPRGTLGTAALLLIAVVVAPLTEEVAYRGVLYPALRERWGVTPAIVLSSAVFALLHSNVVWLGLPILLLGILLARLFERTGSLWPPIAAHALFNLSAVAMWFVVRSLGGA